MIQTIYILHIKIFLFIYNGDLKVVMNPKMEANIMNLLKTKKGNLTMSKGLATAITAIILLVVVLYIYAGIIPTATAAGASMNDTARCVSAGGAYCTNLTTPYCYDACRAVGDSTAVAYSRIPLSGLFNTSGVIFIIVMAALILAIVLAFLPGHKKK